MPIASLTKDQHINLSVIHLRFAKKLTCKKILRSITIFSGNDFYLRGKNIQFRQLFNCHGNIHRRLALLLQGSRYLYWFLNSNDVVCNSCRNSFFNSCQIPSLE